MAARDPMREREEDRQRNFTIELGSDVKWIESCGA